MLLAVLAILSGIALLIWSADRFVYGAAAFARNLGVPPLVIGLTIVGMGTSAPELLVSALAALGGNSALSIGNAIGSNITNIGLVLGTTALFTPLAIQSNLLKRELPLMLGVMLFGYAVLADGRLARYEGAALLAGLIALLLWMIWSAHRSRTREALTEEFIKEQPAPTTTLKALVWLFLGLVLLLGGARLLVWGAVAMAKLLGVSDLVIGLTVVAVGTSLPELATTLISARRGEHGLALGNVIGSNMFNILGVLGLPGLISPCLVPSEVLTRDYPVMLLLSLLLLLLAYGRQPRHIHRAGGGILLAIFIAYEAWLYWTT